ncbi:MAG: hypothetical protein K0R51_1225 [Cytophagaceae bacterium]|jgi:hypothetical protein|nr:hypothetical protein [Cytophagaceae bacterium]
MNELIKVGERIDSYLKLKGIGINQLGRLTNTSGTQIVNIIKGKKFGLDKIYILLQVLPDLSPNWLLFGEGEMLKESDAKLTALDKVISENESLKKEIEHLRTQLSYQDKAVDAYQKSFTLVTKANEDLQQVMHLYKSQSDKNQN